MVYREFQDLKLSQYGFGAMRLPVIDGNDGNIDEEQTARMVAYAMGHGVNYYDTAWGYHEGASEVVMGKILRQYPRDSYYLATKFPGYDLGNFPKAAEIFDRQLEKTGHDYFDFYLFHNVNESNIEAFLDPKFGIYDLLMEKKKEGKIRHLGFSAHGDLPVLKRFLEAYGEDLEFCQLQLNYLDWEFQRGREKVELLKEYGIPVWVMEPLRGGRLCNLNEAQENVLRAVHPDDSMATWAFRFLQSIPEVTVILSGASNEEQQAENIETFAENRPLDEQERKAIEKVASSIQKSKAVPCTACRYCTTYCPQELDIPRLLELYNEHILTTSGGLFGFIAPMALSGMPEEKRPAACIGCRSCEQVCPQQIKISEVLADFEEVLK